MSETKEVTARYLCPYCGQAYNSREAARECAANTPDLHFHEGDFVFFTGCKRLENINRITSRPVERSVSLCIDGRARVAAGMVVRPRDTERLCYVPVCAAFFERVANEYIDGEVEVLRRRLNCAEALQKAIHEANARRKD